MSTEKFLMILGAALLLLAFLGRAVWQRHRLAEQEKKGKKAIIESLMLAQGQNEIFDIQLVENGLGKTGLTALLMHVGPEFLELEVLAHVAHGWIDSEAEVYFRISQPKGQTFYKFRSKVKRIEAKNEKSRIVISTPQSLEVGQKRGFIRVKPTKDAVKVIGVWKIAPDKPIPRSTSEIGRPLTHYKIGMEQVAVQVENISASGLAVRFKMQDTETMPVDLEIGSQMLCLLVYSFEQKDEEKLVTFWCTGEVVNSRVVEGDNPALVLGVEFTNWAVMEQGQTDINWFHSSPSRGVSPITQWVMRMNLQSNRLS